MAFSVTETDWTRIRDLVDVICGTTYCPYPNNAPIDESTGEPVRDCPSDDGWSAADQILIELGCDMDWVSVYEVPLCWNRQVVVRFCHGAFGPGADVYNATVLLFRQDDGRDLVKFGLSVEGDECDEHMLMSMEVMVGGENRNEQ